MDEYDLYYTDGRNAVRRVVRPGGVMRPSPGQAVPVAAPAPVMQPAPAPAPVFYSGPPMPYAPPAFSTPPYGTPYPAPAYGAPYPSPAFNGPFYPPTYGAPFGPAPYGAPQPPYGHAGSGPFYPPPQSSAQQGVVRGLEKVDLGTLVSVGMLAYAALKKLPPAPVATNDVATDVVNLITYQSELAKHEKTNEQIRTANALFDKLYRVL